MVGFGTTYYFGMSMKFVMVPPHGLLSLYSKFEGHIALSNILGLGKVASNTIG